MSDSISDAEDLNSTEDLTKISVNKMEIITKELESETNEIRKKAILCEIKSLEKPQASIDCLTKIKKVLSNKKNPVECEICGKYMDGPHGLKIHMSRSHKV